MTPDRLDLSVPVRCSTCERLTTVPLPSDAAVRTSRPDGLVESACRHCGNALLVGFVRGDG